MAVKLFVTYGCGTPLGKNYSVIEGETIKHCYAHLWDCCGKHYAFAYDEKQFGNQAEKYGLTEVPLQRCSMELLKGEE
jgi:hypothetical protein